MAGFEGRLRTRRDGHGGAGETFGNERLDREPGQRTRQIAEEVLGVFVHRYDASLGSATTAASGMSDITALSSSAAMARVSSGEDCSSL